MTTLVKRKCPKCSFEWEEEDEWTVDLQWKPHTFQAELECPYCKDKSNYILNSHNPTGVSHGETHYCICCEKEVFIVVYWDDTAYIEKPSYSCRECGKSFTSRAGIEKDHKMDTHGTWHCREDFQEGAPFGVDVVLKKSK